MKKTSIGFGADLKDRFDEEENIIAQVTNEDLENMDSSQNSSEDFQ